MLCKKVQIACMGSAWGRVNALCKMPIDTKQGAAPTAAAERERRAREVLEIVRALALELKSAPGELRVSLDSSLQRDLGIDSLGLAELLLRLERRFK
ncbi:MAG TPA: phosphopantetheine-binding protein, partial [Afifellaceae bacterium]|nr:phosphopantetheine-binding protein [Afifellaceae bacterium]